MTKYLVRDLKDNEIYGEFDNYEDAEAFVENDQNDHNLEIEENLELPKEIKGVTSYDLQLDADDQYLSEDFDEYISNYLSNEYGYCVNSFNFNVNLDKNNQFKSIDIYNIDWDTTD